MSDTYGNVDAADDTDEAIAWQERVDGWPAITAYKRRMDELCGGLTPVLDVGAGPGLDARRLGAVAIDRSHAMARRGRQHGVPYVVGDALRLPLAGDAVGALRSDRVLQHLAKPYDAVVELTRCLRPGGRLVICDPDQQTLSIAVPSAPVELVDRVRRLRRDVGYRSGTYISALAGWMQGLGLVDVRVDPFPLVLRDPDDAFGIGTWVQYWGSRHGLTRDEGERWTEAIGPPAAVGFFYAVTYFVVSGIRP